MKHLLFVLAIVITAVGCGTDAMDKERIVNIQVTSSQADSVAIATTVDSKEIHAFTKTPVPFQQEITVTPGQSIWVTVDNGLDHNVSLTIDGKAVRHDDTSYFIKNGGLTYIYN